MRKYESPRGLGSSGGGGGGGFSGDPHFMIPVKPDLNICFNWDGQENEVRILLKFTMNHFLNEFQLCQCSDELGFYYLISLFTPDLQFLSRSCPKHYS